MISWRVENETHLIILDALKSIQGGVFMTLIKRCSKSCFSVIPVLAAALLFLSLPSALTAAMTAKELDQKVDVSLDKFVKSVNGAGDFLKASKGVLVFPEVYKAGFWVGGEYGEGAMRVGGKTADYYSLTGGSIGFQFGAQAMTIILVFMQDEALKKFHQSKGWQGGVDGSIAVVDVGGGKTISSTTFNQPIVAFVFNPKGLMVNISLQGAKFTKIKMW
jgi:lipid-binding SYLF domain-containing protein